MLLYTDIWHLTPRNPFSSGQWEYIDVSRDLHFTFFLKIFYLMHMSVSLDVCLCTTCMQCTVPREARWRGQVPWSWHYKRHELPYWEPNLRPRQEHQGLLTTELSLRCPAYFLCQISFIIKVSACQRRIQSAARHSVTYDGSPRRVWGADETFFCLVTWWLSQCHSESLQGCGDASWVNRWHWSKIVVPVVWERKNMST